MSRNYKCHRSWRGIIFKPLVPNPSRRLIPRLLPLSYFKIQPDNGSDRGDSRLRILHQAHFAGTMETALFSPASLFGDGDGDNALSRSLHEQQEQEEVFVERTHTFPPQMHLKIREFSFHSLNANLLWPGTFAFADWLLLHHQSLLHPRLRILELGSGTGALAIFLRSSFHVDITTSDYDDPQIELNIAHNCTSNGLHPLPHIRHTWGEPFPTSAPYWELIIASDILLYVKQYPNLIKTLCFLLEAYQPLDQTSGITKRSITVSGEEIELELPIFIMSWRRRIGKEDEQLFFGGCKKAGLTVRHVGSRVYCITIARPSNR
ncbi:S-adenosyl-L-methionine-dependent methyltransferases superfamily protein [Rhynchospora pubera]|uniref:S-adenosyl-L-methionine-dependent methyltransferases superfamily protein n=1 Tax=Rhynchospora pubera TaxID=906938 RepID=A0AAV8H9C0_9POAL|nr:S-adenosyl-L-methionine-dependent methyltransferases superfamily protein [Rhynchospora pubera]